MTSAIQATIQNHHLLQHPFYQAWMRGELPISELRDYAGQYYFHVSRFPRYLSAIHSNCESEAARRELLANLNDEEGVSFGVSHPELWLRFAEGLGLSREEAEGAPARTAIKNVGETFFRFARSSFHEGLGALYAYESQVPEIASSKIEGLVRNYGVKDPRALEFFSVHEKADVAHRESIQRMLSALPEKEREEARLAAEAAAKALWDFLTEIHGMKACA